MRVQKCVWLAVAIVCVGLIGLKRASAQAATAAISGSITDTSGAVIPATTIQVRNTGTGLTREAQSDSQGRYNVPDLAIGDYELRASKTGFQTLVRAGVTLTVGSQPVIDFQLPVGRAEQTINVEAEVSAVETATATLSSLVNQEQMRQLPLNGRNFEQLILLAPGAISYPAGGSSALVGRAATFSVSGARPEGHAILLDGENIQDWWQRGSGAAVTGTSLGVEAIAEFQTMTNTYSAEFGGNGAVINAATKSGTNGFHGSAYDFLRNSALDARGFFDPNYVPPFRKNQFGGSLGGPVKKDKAFFFVNYEGIRQALGQSTPVFVPSASVRASAVPSVQPIIALYPLPTTDFGNGTGTVTEVANQTAHENYVLARFDYNLSAKDSFFVRYLHDYADLINPSAIPLWPVYDNTKNQFSTIQERHIFSPQVLNAFSFDFSRPVTTESEPETTPALQLFKGRQDATISVTGLTSLGANFVNPFRFLQNKFTLSDDVLWTKNSHSIKIGMSFRRQQINSFSYTYWNGNYNFTGLQGLLNGTPVLFTGAPDGQAYGNRDIRDIALTPYIQDDWKASRRLTINIGLRYEFQSNPVEHHDNFHNVVDPPYGASYTPVTHALASNPSIRNFDPRFGFAYDVFGDHKTSLRGGFGIMHDPYQTYVYFSGYVGTPPFNSLNQTNPSFPVPFQGSGVSQPLPALTFGTDYHIHTTPYMIQYNLNIERELFTNTVLTVGYVGSRGVHLLAFRDFNPPVLTIDANGVQHFGFGTTPNPRINPNFGTLVLTNPSSASRYNSFQMSVNHRLTKNFQAYFSYVFSRCVDGAYTYGGLGGNNGTSSWTNPYNGAVDKGLCSFDIRHNLSFNALYNLPFHGNKLVEGWQLSGIELFRTGVPFTINDGFDRALEANNFATARPNYVAGCDITAGQNRIHWFNPACFQLQPVGTLGNAGRNIGTSPGYSALDFAVLKDTRFAERMSVQFRAELFNILNHTNFAVPALGAFTGNGAVAGNAGTITAIVGTSRQIQFGLKFLF
jgi:hypothetical protein